MTSFIFKIIFNYHDKLRCAWQQSLLCHCLIRKNRQRPISWFHWLGHLQLQNSHGSYSLVLHSQNWALAWTKQRETLWAFFPNCSYYWCAFPAYSQEFLVDHHLNRILANPSRIYTSYFFFLNLNFLCWFQFLVDFILYWFTSKWNSLHCQRIQTLRLQTLTRTI